MGSVTGACFGPARFGPVPAMRLLRVPDPGPGPHHALRGLTVMRKMMSCTFLGSMAFLNRSSTWPCRRQGTSPLAPWCLAAAEDGPLHPCLPGLSLHLGPQYSGAKYAACPLLPPGHAPAGHAPVAWPLCPLQQCMPAAPPPRHPGSPACLGRDRAGGHGGIGLALCILGDILACVVVGRGDDLRQPTNECH